MWPWSWGRGGRGWGWYGGRFGAGWNAAPYGPPPWKGLGRWAWAEAVNPELARSWTRRALELRKERLLAELRWIEDALRVEHDGTSETAK
ncbi:hypothetical protein [Brockia lithotrophica]|uniref:Uncharacterized protein n=1 Tax=Brockia lithotrophica TaxID=933949 RepID=A0A660KW10_9BACL|nr:hypothetical protein [Brockia lithotrophica]RKQ83639.1 hypothetical protein C7438_1669 [Brockia lithotrophica]